VRTLKSAYGGGFFVSISANYSIKAENGRVQTIVPSVSSLVATLPDARTLPLGFTFYLVNTLAGVDNISIDYNNGSGAGEIIGRGALTIMRLAGNTTQNGLWYISFHSALFDIGRTD